MYVPTVGDRPPGGRSGRRRRERLRGRPLSGPRARVVAVVKWCHVLLRSGVYPDLSRIPLPLVVGTPAGGEPTDQKDQGAIWGGSWRKVGGDDGRKEEEVRQPWAESGRHCGSCCCWCWCFDFCVGALYSLCCTEDCTYCMYLYCNLNHVSTSKFKI